MENVSLEIFEVKEFTVDITVPLYWNDEAAWNDGDPLPGTTQIRGMFEIPYERLDLGGAGQDSSQPHVRFPTAKVPYAREGDEIVVNRELPDNAGNIQIIPTTYNVGTARPDGRGVTDCTLFET